MSNEQPDFYEDLAETRAYFRSRTRDRLAEDHAQDAAEAEMDKLGGAA